MKKSEITPDLIGKKCKCICFSNIITGTITKVICLENYTGVHITYNNPQKWGNDIYLHGFAQTDNFGNDSNLKYLEIID